MLTPREMYYGTERKQCPCQKRDYEDPTRAIGDVGKVAVAGIITAGTIGIMGGLLGGLQK